MNIILVKHYFERDIALHFLINKKRILKDIKSLWADLQIGSAYKKKSSEIKNAAMASLKKKFPPSVEITVMDTIVENQHQNAITIVGYD